MNKKNKKICILNRRCLLLLAVLAVLASSLITAFADTTSQNLQQGIFSGLEEVYGIIIRVTIPIAAVCLAASAYQLFFGGSQMYGMQKAKKTLLYSLVGVAIVYLAPLVVKAVIAIYSPSAAPFTQSVLGVQNSAASVVVDILNTVWRIARYVIPALAALAITYGGLCFFGMDILSNFDLERQIAKGKFMIRTAVIAMVAFYLSPYVFGLAVNTFSRNKWTVNDVPDFSNSSSYWTEGWYRATADHFSLYPDNTNIISLDVLANDTNVTNDTVISNVSAIVTANDTSDGVFTIDSSGGNYSTSTENITYGFSIFVSEDQKSLRLEGANTIARNMISRGEYAKIFTGAYLAGSPIDSITTAPDVVQAYQRNAATYSIEIIASPAAQEDRRTVDFWKTDATVIDVLNNDKNTAYYNGSLEIFSINKPGEWESSMWTARHTSLDFGNGVKVAISSDGKSIVLTSENGKIPSEDVVFTYTIKHPGFTEAFALDQTGHSGSDAICELYKSVYNYTLHGADAREIYQNETATVTLTASDIENPNELGPYEAVDDAYTCSVNRPHFIMQVQENDKNAPTQTSYYANGQSAPTYVYSIKSIAIVDANDFIVSEDASDEKTIWLCYRRDEESEPEPAFGITCISGGINPNGCIKILKRASDNIARQYFCDKPISFIYTVIDANNGAACTATVTFTWTDD